MARIKPNINSSSKFELIRAVENLRYQLRQYETLLGVKPFIKEELKGEKGDKGEQGIQGEQGEQGIQGEKGDGIEDMLSNYLGFHIDEDMNLILTTPDNYQGVEFELVNGELNVIL